MAKRKFIDWDSIEPLYRAGSLSLNDICRQYEADHTNSQVWKTSVHHTAIIKKAKSQKWARNLAGKVKARVKEKLVTSSVTSSDQISDSDIIEQVAEVGSSVIIRHRKEILALVEHENFLLEALKDEKDIKGKYKTSLKSKSGVLRDLSAVRSQRIALERQAYNLNDDSDDTGSYEEFLRDIA